MEKGYSIAFSLSAEGVTLPVQTHTCNVEFLQPGRESYPDTDALISLERDVAIGVRTADCVPILLYSPDIPAVAAVHAGWKGTLGGILTRTMDMLCAKGARPENIEAIIGPCVCKDCYEVDFDLADRFAAAGFSEFISLYPEKNNPAKRKPHPDLAAINRFRLLEAGLKESNIRMPRHCTCHSTAEAPGTNQNHNPLTYLYPSWRREKGTDIRLISSIVLR